MAVDWVTYHSQRWQSIDDGGYFLGILDRNWEPVMPIDSHLGGHFPQVFADTGSMSLTIPGEISPGVPNPAAVYFLGGELTDLEWGGDIQRLFNSAAHIIFEVRGRAGEPSQRSVYRVVTVEPEGGSGDMPRVVTITGVDMIEHLKHIPLWADPSNHSWFAQLQFSDVQSGSAEEVSRKLIGRNLLGYQQPSMLHQAFDGKLGSWTMTDDYSDKARWRPFRANMNPIICSPVPSGLPSEHCVVEARWDNAWDLLKPTWDAAGLLPVVDLWLPGDNQPMLGYAALSAPTAIISFMPRAGVSGAVTTVGQGVRSLRRSISPDLFTSSLDFADVDIPDRGGRPPWVVFDVDEGPKMVITKSTDWRFLVGGRSPKIVNTAVKTGIKVAFAGLLGAIPIVGPGLAAAVMAGADAVADLSADRFLNLSEYSEENRKAWHGRSRYLAIAKQGEANSMEGLQKAWKAKEETGGGLSLELAVDDPYPYVPGRDFTLGDTVGVAAWGRIWAGYISGLTWVLEPGGKLRTQLSIGDRSSIADLDAMFAINQEAVRAIFARLTTTISS
ncbi:hypothetical protein CPHO_07045 [Corynebacterium phocae]|uniref:Gp28/Gp37-like domain-containing protein n=1 Tax=Corynebacterium phocae TaxID=161895 RepID=A0A1L7D3K6_9CORY|nr:hypothetical protein [Corynebacterium phocae]APT92690.1 hypothetical protein CPHO_07045 [Corynebacterium phocae]KAA8723579.1 hypothetical protein F4V58_06555 [Corynebacterium phocae]